MKLVMIVLFDNVHFMCLMLQSVQPDAASPMHVSKTGVNLELGMVLTRGIVIILLS